MNLIGLVDCNNFFVSCERLFRPDLIGKPVVVLSSNDGCVVARSNEVKALGVPMGVPVFKVKDIFTEAGVTCFSSNFMLYRDISSRVMTVLKEEVGQVEQYSIDESFFTLKTDTLDDIPTTLLRLKHTIEKKVGIPVSIGMGKTKTIAKYASEKEKRGTGVCVLVGASWQQETPLIPLSAIWGIGQKTTAKMTSHGLHTVKDLLQADTARISKLFGIEGTRKRNELLEQVMYPLGVSITDQKSIMNTRSFSKIAVGDKAVIEDALAYHIHEAAAEARAKGLYATTLHILALPSRYGDWILYNGYADQVLDAPSNDTAALLAVASSLLTRIYHPDVPYKKAGIILGGLTPSPGTSTLFSDLVTAKPEVSSLMDSLNAHFGLQTLRLGKRGKTSSWQSTREKLSPHYTTQWSQIAEVKG